MPKPSWMPLGIEEASAQLGLTRRHMGRTIAPIMAEIGDAYQEEVECPWFFNTTCMGRWKLYLATRRNLIEAGVWNPKRRYSVQDFDDIVIGGLYEDYQPNSTKE